MSAVYTIDGAERGDRCKRVKHGKQRGCTMETCKDRKGRWKFMKGTRRCK